MFVKLTKLDSRPIWLNASFIVTVEPRRDGVGSIVVPIGDGLDYDVRESVDDVLKLLEGAPTASVVPVQVSDGLAKPIAPKPVAAETPADAAKPADETAAEEEKPKKRAARTRKAATPRKTKTAKKEEEEKALAPAAPTHHLELSAEEVVRLRKMAPKSIGKLKNTLMTQFKIADVLENVAALEQQGVIAIEGSHVNWPLEAAEV